MDTVAHDDHKGQRRPGRQASPSSELRVPLRELRDRDMPTAYFDVPVRLYADAPFYIVARRSRLHGERVNPGEIIFPWKGYWRRRGPIPPAAIEGGWLVPVTEDMLDMLVWPCPCDRFWATREAFVAHDYTELTPSDETAAKDVAPADIGWLPPAPRGSAEDGAGVSRERRGRFPNRAQMVKETRRAIGELREAEEKVSQEKVVGRFNAWAEAGEHPEGTSLRAFKDARIAHGFPRWDDLRAEAWPRE